MLPRDRERLAELARAGAKRACVLDTATPALPVDTGRRFQRSDQCRLRNTLLAADEVEAPVDAVRAVNVRVARRPEHCLVARRAAAVAVAGGVLLVVGLDLDDAPADAVDEQRDTDQVRGDLVDAPCEEATAQHWSVRRSGGAPGTPPRGGHTRRRTRGRRRRSRSAGSSQTPARPPRDCRST